MWIEDELALIEQAGLRRVLHSLPASGGKLRVDGRWILNFSSNDYLDLAGDARVKAAAVAAIERFGCGATASRLMCGHLELHEQLEAALAALVGGPAALVFGSGFLTGLGVITSLANRHDEIFADRLNHASLVDGAALSGAKVRRYRHLDMAHLEALLRRPPLRGQGRGGLRGRLIITDSIFSMDGDSAPLPRLQALADEHDAMLIVDEAHAIGVFGSGGGAGRLAADQVHSDVVLGTLSKALGSYGGFAVCSPTVRDYLINRARSFIYSTALAPPCLAAALAAVEIVAADPTLGQTLLANVCRFHSLLVDQGFDLPPCVSQILPLPVGDNDKALAFAHTLAERGILTRAIRPPTVPAGTARLRLSVTLAHSQTDLERAAGELGDVARKLELL